MTSIILPPSNAPANPSEGELYYDNTAKQVKFRDNAGFKALGTADLQGEPHIITKKLFPAYLGKLLDDTTSHSGDYGTEQSDGRMYYYTDIAGSKPIHDPRIGAHFGSQRHKFKSLQLLEQETATHGKNVFSVDGREWMRAVGITGNPNNSQGNYLLGTNSFQGFIEIVGYFSDANILIATRSQTIRGFTAHIDGSVVGSERTDFETTVDTPLGSRYVDRASLVNLDLNQTLGLHTLKIKENADSDQPEFYGIELIAQDTTSSSTKVQIQVPAQDVVSYGRKFSVSATAQHYDPFNGFTSGASVSSYVDTATSLGLSKWLHSSTYYRPYNGMRVVKWIDENGAIKTSVTCMPPNAKSIADSSALTNATAKANASVANDTFYPTFEAHTTSVNEDNLHEVAKTFHFREFGNGSANGGTGATWADASMLNSADDIAYCMDDGLTSISATDVRVDSSTEIGGNAADSGDYWYMTFIGTGITTVNETNNPGPTMYCQNLPYGSHIIKVARSSSANPAATTTIDGVSLGDVGDNYGFFSEVSFYQPKKPPIPDSACVLADYMVFADFKPQTTAGTQLISKGVRRQNISRDVFFDETDGDSFTFNLHGSISEGFQLYLSGTADSDTSMKLRIPSFGTNYVHRGYQHDTRSKLFIGDTDNDSNATKDNTASHGSYAHLTNDLTLGVHQFGSNAVSGANGTTTSFDIVTPIHTSHHYQPFETPFLHELIGGDRSMEQTNLICSSDGKSWDEVARDTSYIGNLSVQLMSDAGEVDAFTVAILDECRGFGTDAKKINTGNKDFAIAYDRLICLRNGEYEFHYGSIIRSTGTQQQIDFQVNGLSIAKSYTNDTTWSHGHISGVVHLKRGDYVQVFGGYWSNNDNNHVEYYIKRLS